MSADGTTTGISVGGAAANRNEIDRHGMTLKQFAPFTSYRDRTMNDTPDDFQPFRGLPITREQDAEIRAYITHCEANGSSWDTLELDYIIIEMLYPTPSDDRLNFCDEYARELAKNSKLTGEKIGCEAQEIFALTNGICSETEWKWIVYEAAKFR